jgi:dynein heavy chain
MGHTIGRFVVVFNCSNQFNYRGMGKIFKGLSQGGVWGCFDEFNRIQSEVLSVVAQQLQSIFAAQRAYAHEFVFIDGEVLTLAPGLGVFVTMNAGYVDRFDLPENLKALFRSVAMITPDMQLIMRVKLAAGGFHGSELLAQKLFVLYQLCEHQLSKQQHYDFGLRNSLSVLRALGSARRAGHSMNIDENQVFMRTVRDMNLSKLVSEDEPLFLSLMADVFPDTRVAKSFHVELQDGIDKQMGAPPMAGEPPLVKNDGWMAKVVQLHETATVRWGIVMIGPSRSGKSTCIRTYLATLNAMGTRTSQVKVNPKAMTAAQMVGSLDLASNEWHDGVFAALWRRACSRQNTHTWLVLDGPIDSSWIESMNTVLDDNKQLTLANGERIAMKAGMRLVCEVDNMDHATPATVSRVGIVYMSTSTLGWAPLIEAWLPCRCWGEAARLRRLFDAHMEATLGFVLERCEPNMHLEKVQSINS